MSAEFNKINILGYATRDPEYKEISENNLLCAFAIASNHEYVDKKTGYPKKEVTFIDVSVFSPFSDICKESNVKKGSHLFIEGRIKQEKWLDTKTNQNRSKHCIIANNIVIINDNKQTEDPQLIE